VFSFDGSTGLFTTGLSPLGPQRSKFGMVQKRVTAQGGTRQRPQVEAPRSEASALGACWLLPARPQPPYRFW